MGSLTYDGTEFPFDDRLLAHLQIVIALKLRHQEGFMMSWRNEARIGDGRTSIWISPYVPMQFRFFGSRLPTINPAWLAALTLTASSSTGLLALSEFPYDPTLPAAA